MGIYVTQPNTSKGRFLSVRGFSVFGSVTTANPLPKVDRALHGDIPGAIMTFTG
jgi:hypothetical protein